MSNRNSNNTSRDVNVNNNSMKLLPFGNNHNGVVFPNRKRVLQNFSEVRLMLEDSPNQNKFPVTIPEGNRATIKKLKDLYGLLGTNLRGNRNLEQARRNQIYAELPKHNKELFQLIQLTNFLDYTELLNILTDYVAYEIKKCKTVGEIADRFDIKDVSNANRDKEAWCDEETIKAQNRNSAATKIQSVTRGVSNRKRVNNLRRLRTPPPQRNLLANAAERRAANMKPTSGGGRKSVNKKKEV